MLIADISGEPFLRLSRKGGYSFTAHLPRVPPCLFILPSFARAFIALHGGSGNTEFRCQTDLGHLGIRAKLLDDVNPQRGIGLMISLISLRISLIEANRWPSRLTSCQGVAIHVRTHRNSIVLIGKPHGSIIGNTFYTIHAKTPMKSKFCMTPR